jgi:hypothetical protein
MASLTFYKNRSHGRMFQNQEIADLFVHTALSQSELSNFSCIIMLGRPLISLTAVICLWVIVILVQPDFLIGK